MKTLTQICNEEFDGNIAPDMMVEFSYSGEELNVQSDYLDEVLETHGDMQVEWHDVPNPHTIRVIFNKED